jgi:glucokinase
MTIDQVNFQKDKVLLLDIGGTNIRTCKAFLGSNELIEPFKETLTSLNALDTRIQKFLDVDPSIKHLVFSIAGPKLNTSISMTNRDFKIEEAETLLKFNIESCHILNDWESIGHSFVLYSDQDKEYINTGKAFNSTALVIGPGTGLGAALVVNDDIVLPTEIGNSSFSLQSLMINQGLNDSKAFNVVEDLISGGGLARIYHHFSGKTESPEKILELHNQDESAKKSIDCFLTCLSQILSELALTYIPGKGIYFAGSLMRSLHDHIEQDKFLDNFLINRKEMHAEILKSMPIALIKKEMTCLHGNLNFINKLCQSSMS